MPNLTFRQWVHLFLAVILVDLLVFFGIVYYFMTMDSLAATNLPSAPPNRFMATVTATPTPWAGPGLRVTATPTWPPTPIATRILSDNGFPSGFVPTPRPTRQAKFNLNLNLNAMFSGFPTLSAGNGLVDVPDINQTLYPEKFFRAGSNNACGPVALFAAMQGLGANISYAHVRNIAVNNEFGSDGMTVSGLINTAVILNNYLGQPFIIEQSRDYHLQDLTNQLQQKGVVIVLVRIKKVEGQYQISGNTKGSIGHFLVIERINPFTSKVKIGGSTLGMGDVSLADFVSSWSNEPQKAEKRQFPIKFIWKNPIKEEPKPGNWALMIKRRS